MIFDKIENVNIYYGLNDKIQQGFEFILNNNLCSMRCGRHEIADGIYANVQEIETKPPHEAKFEAHKKYIDIQYVIKGCERMDFSHIDNFTTQIPYDSEKDVEFLSLKDECLFANSITVNEGEFAIFYPHDCHAPMLSANEKSEKIKKVIVKITAD